jgi:hypothetical protein
VKGTWREGSLAGDPEGYVEKALETAIFFHRGPVWRTWRRACLSGAFERWMKGALKMESLSLKRLCGGGLRGGAPSLQTLEDMLRKAPDTGIALQRGPFTTEGNLESGGGLIYRGL